MTTVVSFRVPSELDWAIRDGAHRSRMLVSDVVGLLLEHSLCGRYDFESLPDTQEILDTKLDVRLAETLISRLRVESERRQVAVSVYIRKILYAYHAKRLVLVAREGHYTLEENDNQARVS